MAVIFVLAHHIEPWDYQIKHTEEKKSDYLNICFSHHRFDLLIFLCPGSFHLRFPNDHWVKIENKRQYYPFHCFLFPTSFSVPCLTRTISLPSIPQGVCSWPQRLNLGVRTHRAAGVYSTATPVKNTLLWKYRRSVHSETSRQIRLVVKHFHARHLQRISFFRST